MLKCCQRQYSTGGPQDGYDGFSGSGHATRITGLSVCTRTPHTIDNSVPKIRFLRRVRSWDYDRKDAYNLTSESIDGFSPTDVQLRMNRVRVQEFMVYTKIE